MANDAISNFVVLTHIYLNQSYSKFNMDTKTHSLATLFVIKITTGICFFFYYFANDISIILDEKFPVDGAYQPVAT